MQKPRINMQNSIKTCPIPSGRSADGQIRTRCTSKVQRNAQQIPIRSKPSPGVTETEVAQAGMIFETSKFKFEYINIGDG